MITTSSPSSRAGLIPDADPDADRLAGLLGRLKRESTFEKAWLMEYWLSLRDCGMPDYRRFDPLDIPNLLGDLAVVAVERPGPRFRFRLYGTRIAELRGRDLTGLYLDDPGVLPGHHRQGFVKSYLEVAESGQPAMAIVPYEPDHGVVGNYHRLLLPFADGDRGGRRCDIIVASFQSVPLEPSRDPVGLAPDPTASVRSPQSTGH